MMEHLLKLRPHVTSVLNDPTVSKAKGHHLNARPEQYGLMEALIQLLKNFEIATTVLTAEKSVTISYVLPFALKLQGHLMMTQKPWRQ